MNSFFLQTIVTFTALGLGLELAAGEWRMREDVNVDLLGRALLIERAKKPVARFVYGKGQMKPFLHVYSDKGELLTNGGLDKDGQPVGQFPHHRGIFIGWKISSELGNYDLWHMNNGGKMEVLDVAQGALPPETPAFFRPSAALFTANIAWRTGKSDASGSDLLLNEKRTLFISRPQNRYTQIDAVFELQPARDLNFAGDLQHSGVHFRAANEVADRASETSYITEPPKVAKGPDLKWCHFIFPIGTNWYSATQLNAPSNPVEELSTRDYGRFGYFFKRGLKKGEPLTLKYRFIVAPAKKGRDTNAIRRETQQHYAEYIKAIAGNNPDDASGAGRALPSSRAATSGR